MTTDDGFILSVQRIPNGRKGRGRAGKPPVIIQHGVLVVSSSIYYFRSSVFSDSSTAVGGSLIIACIH